MRRGAVLTVLATAALGAWFLFDGPDTPEHATPGAGGRGDPPSGVAAPTAGTEPAAAAGERRAPIARAIAPGFGTLRGRVVDAGGAEVAGAWVVVGASPRDAFAPGQEPRIATGADGTFVFRFARACDLGRVAVEPTAVTSRAGRWLGQRLALGQEREITLRVDAGVAIRGRVVDPAGTPVASARVFAWSSEPHRTEGSWSEPPERTAVTGVDGGFELAHVAGGFVLSAEADGMLCLVRLRGTADGRKSLEGLELVVAPTGVLEGRLLDADGAPIAGHRFGNHLGSTHSALDNTAVPGVTKMHPEHNVTTTGAGGSFRFVVVRNHSYLWEVQHPNHPMWRQHHGVADGFLEARLARGVEVRGHVFSADGAAAVGAAVVLNDHPDREAMTGATGAFVLRGAQPLEARSYLKVAHTGSALCCVQPLPTDGREVVVHLERGRPLAGVVLDEHGAPVVDAEVAIEGERRVAPGYTFGGVPTWEWAHDRNRTRTDGAGGFAFTDLYAGRFTVRVAPADAPSLAHVVEATAGDEHVRVQIDRQAMRRVAFVGNVRDAVTGAAVGAFRVMVSRVDASGGWQGRTTDIEDAAGHFELLGNDPGRYFLRVQAPGYAYWEAAAADYAPGDHRSDVRLDPARNLEVLVEDDSGQPAVGAALSVRDPATGELRQFPITLYSTSVQVTTGGDGRAQLQGLPARALTLHIAPRAAEPVERAIDLTSPPLAPLRVVVSAPLPVVQFEVFLLGHRPGADLAKFRGEPDRTWLDEIAGRDDVWLIEATAEATLHATGDPERLLSEARCEKVDGAVEVAPGVRWHNYKTTVTSWLGDNTTHGSEGPQPGASLHLRGQRRAMRLTVRVDGYRAAERMLQPDRDKITLAVPLEKQ